VIFAIFVNFTLERSNFLDLENFIVGSQKSGIRVVFYLLTQSTLRAFSCTLYFFLECTHLKVIIQLYEVSPIFAKIFLCIFIHHLLLLL